MTHHTQWVYGFGGLERVEWNRMEWNCGMDWNGISHSFVVSLVVGLLPSRLYLLPSTLPRSLVRCEPRGWVVAEIVLDCICFHRRCPDQISQSLSVTLSIFSSLCLCWGKERQRARSCWLILLLKVLWRSFQEISSGIYNYRDGRQSVVS